MISIDCKKFSQLIIDRKNNIFFFIWPDEKIFVEQINVIFDIIGYKLRYEDVKGKWFIRINLSDFPYSYFDFENQKIHFFQKIPDEGFKTDNFVKEILK